MSELGKAVLLIAIVVCLVFMVQPDAVSSLLKRAAQAPKRVLSEAEMQLFTTTANTGEIVMVGAQGVLLDQGQQAVRVGTDAVSFLTGGSERMRIISNGNVGIGTNSSVNMLVLHKALGSSDYTSVMHLGQMRITNGLGSYSSRALEIALLDNGQGVIQANESNVGYNALLLNPAAGNVGIGTDNPSSKLQVQGNIVASDQSTFICNVSTTNASIEINGAPGAGSGMTMNGTQSWFNQWASAPAPDINQINRLVISSYFATRDSHWNQGAAIAFADMNTNSDYPTQIRGGALVFYTMNGGSGGANNPVLERMRINSFGNVGIGIVGSPYKLCVHGSGDALKLSRGDTVFNNDIAIEYEHWPGLPGYRSKIVSSHVGNGQTDLLFKTATPGGLNHRFSLGYDGNAWLSGYLTQGSDRTLKKNISELQLGLDTVLKLAPVEYHFNDQDEKEDKHFGLIAQDVQSLVPHIVKKNRVDDKLSLSYIEIVPILIKATQEQSHIISQQQQTITSLTDRLSKVESILSQLVR